MSTLALVPVLGKKTFQLFAVEHINLGFFKYVFNSSFLFLVESFYHESILNLTKFLHLLK